MVPAFEDIDWVAVAQELGIVLFNEELETFSLMGTQEHLALAEHLATLDTDKAKAIIDNMRTDGRMTSFDKGCVNLYMSRLH